MSSTTVVANACEPSTWRMDSGNENHHQNDGAKAEQTPMLEHTDLGSCGEDSSSDPQTSSSNKSTEDSSESCCHDDSSKFGGCGKSSCGNGCSGCRCRCSTTQRRCSTSDVKNTKANDILLSNLFKKNPAVPKTDKVDKINLANLVFNPNFKTNGGCVNLPVIRAGQNLAQKNAQRKSTSDLTQLSKEETLDLLAKQLNQPHSLTKTLNDKIKKLSMQQPPVSSSGYSSEESGNVDVGDLIQSLAGTKITGQVSSQNNAARYKTELCRSYQEGGECRFGAACTFAHGPEELRPVPRHPLYKTELCRTYHQHGYCQYGTRCHFIHDADEADKSAPLKGCKSWGRHDQLSGALLSLASSSGILENDSCKAGSNENDVLLANLRRLYALSSHGNEKESTMNQFSNSQPLGAQLSMAHQQFSATQPSLPLSMTQPLPMEALQLGLHRANQMNSRGHMGSSNRLESIANDYANWGMSAPQSPTYPGLSPFGSYQQFSPLPHHGPTSGGHPSSHQGHHQGYAPATYPFSATAPDLSAALNVSPYTMSPPAFSNTVNVGHMLPDHNGNFPPISGGKSSSTHGLNSHNQQQVWPQTSAEVSSAIDRELFGFGLDSHGQSSQQHHMGHSSNSGYQQFQPAYFPGANQYNANHHGSMIQPDKYNKKSGGAELMNYLNSDKYIGEKQSLKPIREMEDSCDQMGRQKVRRSISGSNVRRTELQTEL